MMYGYMTMQDGTGVAHSDMSKEGTVKVYFEKPVTGGFLHATCYLPSYQWEENVGFSEKEIDFFNHFLQNNAHLIIEFSQEGGFANASGF